MVKGVGKYKTEGVERENETDRRSGNGGGQVQKGVERERNRQTDGQTETQRERQRDVGGNKVVKVGKRDGTETERGTSGIRVEGK